MIVFHVLLEIVFVFEDLVNTLFTLKFLFLDVDIQIVLVAVTYLTKSTTTAEGADKWLLT